MPAACTLLLLLGLLPPAGSSPLASQRRLPPPPPPPSPRPPPSRSRLGRPCSAPAAGHAGSPVLRSSHQERRSLDAEMMVSGSPMGSLEMVPRLAWDGQWAVQPAQHGAVQQWHGGGVTPLGAGALDSLSAGTATHSHPSPPGGHRAVGGRKRGRRALAPAEGTPLVPADVGTNVTEGTLSGWRGTLELGTSEMRASELGTTELRASELATTKLGTSEMGALELGTSEMGTSELGTSELATTKLGTSEMGTLELVASELGTTKLGTSELATTKLGTSELGTSELGTTKLGTSEMRTSELGTSEMATTKLGTSELATTKLGTSELATTKLGTTKLVSSELATTKLGTSELETSELGTSGLATIKLGTLELVASELVASELETSELGTLEVGASSSTTGTEPPTLPAETRGLGTSSSFSQPASSWVGTELPSSPPTDTAAPSTPGSNGPSTLLPGSPGQPQSLIPASSTQTGTNHIPRHLTRDSTNTWPATGSAFGAMGSSYQPSNASATEGRGSDFPITSTSDSITATKGGGRTFRSVPASTRLATAAEIPTSGTEISSSSDQTWSPGMHLGAQGGGGRDAPGSLLTGSPSASEGTSTTFSSSPHPKSIPSAGELALHSDAHRAEVPSVAAGAAGSPANSITDWVTKGSATTTDLTSSSWDTSGTLWKHHSNSSREATGLPAPSGVTLPSSSLPASESTFRGVRSSHRPVISSRTEKNNPLGSSPSSTVLSASSSILWAAGVSTPSIGTLGTDQSSVSSVRGTYGAHGSRGVPGFTKGVADPSLMSSHPPSEAPSPAPGSSHVPFSTLSTETRTHLSTATASLSPAATKGGGRTFRSVPASTSLPQTTEISTPAAETSSSPDHSAQAAVGISATALPRDLLLTGVPSAAGSASTAEGSLAAGELPDAPLTSTPGSRSEDGNVGTSAPTLPHPSSSESIPLPSSLATDPGTRGGVSQRGAGLGELPTELLPGFSSSISVPSSSPSSSERGRRVSGAPTETVYVSTTLSSHKEGTSQAAAQGSMWSTVSESPTSHPDTAGEPHTGPLPSSTAWPGAGQTSSSRTGYPGPKVTFASRISTYFSSASEPSTVGSSSSTKGGMSSPITGPAHGSASSAGGGERTLHSGVTVTVPGGTGSSSSHPGTSSPGSASGEQSGVPGGSSRTRGSVGSATETALPRSSKMPTYSSSFQSSLTSFSSSHQAASSMEAEKRTSLSHTDGTYISTTYTRGGERTLLSISNSSTSADSSESSTFFSDISSASDSSKSIVAQGRRSNTSSAAGVVGPSTEPLLVHPSRLLTSAGSARNATLIHADSEWLPTDTSPLSSSAAFPASSSPSPPHRSLSATPPPTYLFATSKSPEQLSSSVVASWSPLQALSSPLPTSSLLSPPYSSLLPPVSLPSSVRQPGDGGGAAAATTRRVPSTAAVAGSSPRGTSKPGVTPHPKAGTAFTTPPWPTAPMEQQGGRAATALATAAPGAATTQRGRATPAPTTASSAPRGEPTGAPLSPTESPANGSVAAAATVKPPVPTTAGGRWPAAGDASTPSTRGAPTPSATEHLQTSGESTAAVDATTAKPGEVTEENIPVTSPSEAPPTTRSTVSVATTWAATKATAAPPLSSTGGPRMPPPATDVDKCLSNPCPALATCNNTRGSFICQCPLGYELEKGKCNLVRIFMGQVPLRLNATHGKYAELLQVEGEILAMLNSSLSGLPGYHHSTVKVTREANFVHVSVQSTFSLASNVTFYDVVSSVKSYIRACKAPTETCQFISSLKPLHRVGSLCKQKAPECDQETSECTDFDGVALCRCKSGYFKYNKMDHSCRACEDGYKLENETCVSCPFGLGGFNCGNPYQLITVVIAVAGGGLLLIMGIALTVTCCRKNKNDISKLIFKSGDFQMSPYAEYPKNPRAQEWGRETIEMQENGSTKNLLQMTDVYYSPTGLRNPELERNGLYPPYTGLPGSRHSCIYPGQYNPSFISDETRRRDYF